MLRDINEIQALATKYSKAQLAHMAQVGMIDPTKAVMAGMMIDRIQKQNMQPPQTTVAQDVLQAPAPMPQGAPQQMPEQPQAAGMAALPSNVGNYAGGGIVAFAGEDESLVRDDLGYLPSDIAALEADQVLSGRGGPSKGSMPEKTRKFLENKDKPKEDFFTPMPGRGAATKAGLPEQTRKALEKDRSSAPIFSSGDIDRYMAANKGLTSLLDQQQTASAPVADRVPPPVERRELPPIVSRTTAPSASSLPPEVMATSKPSEWLPPINTGNVVIPTEKPEALTELGEQQRREKHYKEMGIDPKMYEKLIAAQEEKRSKLPSKDEALGHALMQAGFGLMGARRGQEWQTLGKEAQGALTSYQGALKERRALEDKIDEAKQGLVLAEQQYKKTGADADLAAVESRRKEIAGLKAQDVKAQNDANMEANKLGVQLYGVDRMAAAQELASLRSLIGTKYHADTMAAAQRWIHEQTPTEIKAVNEVYAHMKEVNPNATWLDAWNSRAGQGKTGILSDEDLFKSWDKRFSEGKKLGASKEEKKFAQDYPTWQSFANAMRKQVGAPTSTPGAGDTGGWGKMSVSGQ